jgi:NAD(P)H-nitrite reductase large subunit
MSTFRHVIIGNSAAGLNAARTIREIDQTAEIVMLTAEDCLAYSPVVLPYMVSGKIREPQMYITDRAFYDRHRIDLRLGTTAEGIDTGQQQVHLQDGNRLAYDRLLIATGASARKPAMDTAGVEDRIFTLRTMADARAIANASKKAADVLMIGAGLVGLETGYALQKNGKKVTIIAKSDHLLSQNSDAQCAHMIQDKIETKGVRFLFDRDVVELSRTNGRIRVKTDQQDEFFVDLIVVGKGVDPNLKLVKDTKISTDQGIKVNLAMQTSVPGIYAAGDVAQARHLLSGNSAMFGNWPSACIEGKIAGCNMAGKKYNLAGEVAYNVLPVFDCTAAFLERRDAGDDQTQVLTYINKRKSIYRKILIKNNRIVGAVMLGACQDAGVVLYLLRKRKNIARIKDTLASGRALWGDVMKNNHFI